MDLIDQENQKPNQTKKIIKTLLIISIIAVIITIILMIYLSSRPEQKISKENKIYIDNQESGIPTTGILLITSNGEQFLSIKELTYLVEYNYFNGEYLKFSEDINKCYIENIVKKEEKDKEGKVTTKNISNIVGMEANSNKIYKTNSESKLDYERIEISNEILQQENNLYISIKDVRSCIWNICRVYNREWFSNIYI